MSLLAPRNANRTIILLVLSIFVVLFLAPVPSSMQKHTGMGAATVWAGSPDETLNPPPTPPKRAGSVGSYSLHHGISARLLFSMFWRAYWTTVRF
jgi:hypothetical protein